MNLILFAPNTEIDVRQRNLSLPYFYNEFNKTMEDQASTLSVM